MKHDAPVKMSHLSPLLSLVACGAMLVLLIGCDQPPINPSGDEIVLIGDSVDEANTIDTAEQLAQFSDVAEETDVENEDVENEDAFDDDVVIAPGI